MTFSTSAEKAYPFLVRVTAKESRLPKDSTVNPAVILTVDKTRLNEKSGNVRLDINENMK